MLNFLGVSFLKNYFILNKVANLGLILGEIPVLCSVVVVIMEVFTGSVKRYALPQSRV